jgi:hypothetical protein
MKQLCKCWTTEEQDGDSWEKETHNSVSPGSWLSAWRLFLEYGWAVEAQAKLGELEQTSYRDWNLGQLGWLD